MIGARPALRITAALDLVDVHQLVDALGGTTQRQLAQRDQVALLEEILRRAASRLGSDIHLPRLEALEQFFRRDIDQRDFIPFLESRADLCIRFLRLLSQRLRRTDEMVEMALFERLETRLAKALVQLASSSEGGRQAGPPYLLCVSQQELSDIVGAARENVNKLLRTWQRAGLLELGKRRIVIRDLDALGKVQLT